MFFLAPEKLLIIFVVAIIVLGPEKLPRAARQLGAAWRLLQSWHSRLETEVRQVFPELPPMDQVTEAVRSPLRYLDGLVSDGQVTAPAAASADGEAHFAVSGSHGFKTLQYDPQIN